MDKLKLKYFHYHLAVSIFIVISVALICQFIWFPSPFLHIDGTWIALLIMSGVDITVGPLLTLITVSSNKSKGELFTDILIIVSIQIVALAYGVVQIKQEKVWAIVHLDGAFNVVAEKEILEDRLPIKYDLPRYKGVYYGMVLNSDLPGHQNSNHPLIYSPEKFRQLTKEEMTKASFPFKNLPLSVKQKYSSGYIFKILAGKNRPAIMVFDNKLKLIDILLIP